MHRVLLLLISLSLLSPWQTAAAEIKIGIDNNPPLTFINQQGQADGLVPELFKRIAEQENWSISYIPCQWKQCLELLDRNDIDILPAIAYTPERAKKYHFATEALLTGWGQIYHRPDQPLSSILELAGKKCAVLEKDVYYIAEQGLKQAAESFGIRIDFVEVATNRKAFELLAAGQVDAAMVGRLFGIKNHHQYNLLPAPIMIKPIQVRPAFSPLAPPQLVSAYDRLLKDWKESTDSVYYQSIKKWLGAAPARFPAWLGLLICSLAGVLSLLAVMTLWTRRQVKAKTLELAAKNRQLEKELEKRHEAERQLLNRERQYRVFFEESQSVMVLVDPENGAIVDANPAACAFYKYSLEEIRSKKMWQINRLGEDEVRQRLEKAKHLKQQRFEFVHTLADDREVPVEVYRSPIEANGRTLLYVIVHDISKRKAAEKALEEHNQFLQAVIDGVSDPLMVIDFDYRVLTMNNAARRQLHNGARETNGVKCHQISHSSMLPCSSDEHPCPLAEVRESGQPVIMIHQHESEQGRRIVELTASPLANTAGDIYAVIEVARDITERLQIEELLNENEKRLHHLAHHDPLTKLPNRLLFNDRLKQALSKVNRRHRQVALFFLDLDNFKTINDSLGHDYGDLLLVDVANRLRNCVRESDTVARLGGDEFLILLEEVESIEMIEHMAERIAQALNHELKKDLFHQRVSASIGISIYPEDAGNAHQLMKNADLAMYRAKSLGKGGYQFYSSPQGRFLFD